MSSLTRPRSLRKPSGLTALPPKDSTKERSQDHNRNASPSRLPTKPASRARSSTATGPTRSTSAMMSRPGSSSSNASSLATTAAVPRRSMSLGKKPARVQDEQRQQQRAASGTTTTRRETNRYPPLSSATRPKSTVVRSTSAGLTASASAGARRTTPTHSRANSAAVTGPTSTTTTRGAPSSAAQERKTTSRPPSRDPSSTTAPPPPSTPKRRAFSVDRPPPPPPTTPTGSTATIASGQQQAPRLNLNRPAFSTLQQRYSPSKTAAAPPTSPSKLPANIAASAETSRLQAELLQLHLLHRASSGGVEAQWQASAKRKLGVRFHALRDAHRALAARETAEAEGANIAALQHWAVVGTRSGASLEDKVQALDAVMTGVWAVSDPGGKYARVVRRFERWVERVMDLDEARASGTIGLVSGGRSFESSSSGTNGGSGGGMEEALFIQDLDPAWADECAGMAHKLEGWRAQLEKARDYPAAAPSIGSGSSLERMLDGSGALIEGILSELGAMEEIRQAALAREEEWIEAMNRDDDDNDTPRAGAVWRAM